MAITSNQNNNTSIALYGQLSSKFQFICSSTSDCHLKKKYAFLADYQGELCHGCGSAKILWTPFTCPYYHESAENKEHKRGRFYVRAFRGVECGYLKKYRFRWFVLSESDEALSAGLDFGQEYHRFLTWLRYRCPDFQYLVVEHRQGDLKRRNWHVLSYGSDKLPVLKIRDYWLGHYKSTVTGMAEVKNIMKAVTYLAGYLSDSEKFIRSWHSQGWVFPGWVGFNREYHRRYGEYVTAEGLAKLSLLKSSAREYELDYLVQTGYNSQHYGEENGL